MRRLLLSIGLLLFLSATAVTAQVPRLINYQGSLVQDAFPVDGTRAMTFALYSQATGGSPLWSTARPDVAVTNGRFSAVLGTETAFPEGLFAEQDALYLQVDVDGQSLSRLQLASTAYALRAQTADAVAPGSITPAALADGAVQPAALAPGAVTSAAIANDTVTDDDLAAGAVRSQELAEGAVANEDIADGAITSSKLRDGSVTPNALVDASVTSDKLADGAVGQSKIAPGAAVRSLNDLTDQVALEGGDNVSISTDATNGVITISAADGIGLGQPSSRRWKTDIRPLEDAVALVEQLRGVRYTWEDDGRPDVGLIAEDVGAVVPEVVTYEANGTDARTVNYGRLVAVLVEAVKAQQRALDRRDAQANALADRVARLERLIQQRLPEQHAEEQRLEERPGEIAAPEGREQP